MRIAHLQSGLYLLAALLLGSDASAAEVPQETAVSRCSALTSLRIPGSTLEIQKAVRLAATGTTPTHCKVEGVLEPRTGSDGKPYAIGFAIALPESWNGRFLFQGGGGLNGSVNPPLGAAAAGDKPALARGFAVVSTDTGQPGQRYPPAPTRNRSHWLGTRMVQEEWRGPIRDGRVDGGDCSEPSRAGLDQDVAL